MSKKNNQNYGQLPEYSKYVIIGGGIHGLSTAYHLALGLKKTGKGDGNDIVIIEKEKIGAGASGIACGVVRNNYSQSAMRELMAYCVDVWESDAEAYSYHSVGYMQINTKFMAEQCSRIAREQKEIGYKSEFISGQTDCKKYMKGIFHDWQAQEIESIIHEKRGGYANNRKSLDGLESKVRSIGVNIVEGTTVNELEKSSSGSNIQAVKTSKGKVKCDYVIIGVGPWVGKPWEMLDLPDTIDIRVGSVMKKAPMWTYWSLQEGTMGVDPSFLQTNNEKVPPVIHVDSELPLVSCKDGSLVKEKPWGIYYKPDFNFGGVQGGASPFKVKESPVHVDPYGENSPYYLVNDDFILEWVSALAHCHKRFEDTLHLYKRKPSGGIGAMAPDNFPIFDVFSENCYIIADSNHGYKMIGVGKLVAEEIVSGQRPDLLKPFRFSRFDEGDLIPESNSPFPWS